MPSPPLPGQILAGKYRIERPIAKGGMGSVWVAKDLALDRDVAVKFMDPSLVDSADARSRFEREAKAAAQLSSSHVVQVFEYGVADEVPYLVMELMAGEALSTRLKHRRRLTLRETIDIIVPTCKALQQAHNAGIVHRDMKPANIFLAASGDDEVVKILDFGIAKALGSGEPGEATKTGMLLGSPQYMSPEQIRAAKTVTHQTDIWSVGVIAYRALTGVIPFKSDETGDLLIRICSDPVVPASQHAPELPPGIDGFFERALARDLSVRFQSAREMASALAALAESDASMTPFSFPSASLPPPPAGAPSTAPTPQPSSTPSVPPAQALTTAAMTMAAAEAPAAKPPSRVLLLGAVAVAVAAIVVAVLSLTRSGGSSDDALPAAASDQAAPGTTSTAVSETNTASPVVSPMPEPAPAATPSQAPAAASAAAPSPPKAGVAPKSPTTTAAAPAPTPPPTPAAPPPTATEKKKNPLDMELK